MKCVKVNVLRRSSLVKMVSLVLAAALAFGSSMWAMEYETQVPELVTFVDMDDIIEIEKEETPLAVPKVTKTIIKKKKKKQIRLERPSSKSYTQNFSKKTKKNKNKKTIGNTTTTVETIIDKVVTNHYTKGSDINNQTTTVTKTKITTVLEGEKNSSEKVKNVSQPISQQVSNAAPKLPANVSDAFEKLGFRILINNNVPYTGHFDARTRTITLKKTDSALYHEMGHFVGFIAGNFDTSKEFEGIYNREKHLYTAFNKIYVTNSSAEYFAESFRNYCEAPAVLQNSRPQTYAAIHSAITRITNAQVQKIKSVYGPFWGI